MKARRLVKENGKYNIVYFGSHGIQKSETKISKNSNCQFIEGDYFSQINLFDLYIYNSENESLIKILFTWIEQGTYWGYRIKVSGRKNNIDVDNEIILEVDEVDKDILEIDITGNDIYNKLKEYQLISKIILECNAETEFRIEAQYFPSVAIKVNGYESLDKNSSKYKEETIAMNYSTRQEGVRDSLIARLDLIKGELWYRRSYGLPLLEKIKSKGIIDSIIINYIMDHPDVVNIEQFNSYFSEEDEHKYVFDCTINTVYNEQISFSNQI